MSDTTTTNPIEKLNVRLLNEVGGSIADMNKRLKAVEVLLVGNLEDESSGGLKEAVRVFRRFIRDHQVISDNLEVLGWLAEHKNDIEHALKVLKGWKRLRLWFIGALGTLLAKLGYDGVVWLLKWGAKAVAQDPGVGE